MTHQAVAAMRWFASSSGIHRFDWSVLQAALISVALIGPSAAFAVPPDNDDLENHDIVSAPFPYAPFPFDASEATTETNEPLSPGCVFTPMGKTVWYRLTASSSSIFRIETVGSTYDTVLAYYLAPAEDFTTFIEQGCDDDGGSGTLSDLIAGIGPLPFLTYFVQVGVYGDGTAAMLDFNVLNPYNNTFEDAGVVASPLIEGPFDVSSATTVVPAGIEPVNPTCVAVDMGKTVWYGYTPSPSVHTVYAETLGSSYDTVLAVYTGAFQISLSETACSDDDGPGTLSQLSFAPTGGTTYWFQIGSYNDGAAGDLTFSLTGSVCGNGAVEPGEQCDDGGVASGDCCDSSCQFESFGSGCDDGFLCTSADICDGLGMCSGFPPECFDGNSCTDDICNPGTGFCEFVSNSDPCDDGVFCNGTDTCQASACSLHTGDPCPGPDGDLDCVESCDEGSDTCALPDGNGAPCSDGDACSDGDLCQSGVCVLGPLPDCDDVDLCTTDSCVSPGGCVNAQLPDDDMDGRCNPQDNCPFAANMNQVNTDSLPAGDACQCGDLDEDGDVDAADAELARYVLVGSQAGASANVLRCNVVGPSDGGVADCGVDDIFELRRHADGFSATIGDVCDAYLLPPP